MLHFFYSNSETESYKLLPVKTIIPQLVTLSRIGLIPVLIHLIFIQQFMTCGILYIFMILSDALDGYLARKFLTKSELGMYLDCFADFLVVLAVVCSFVVLSIYPFWIVIVLVLVFLQFIATSHFFEYSYDPIGKYYGTVVYGMTLLTFLIEKFALGCLLFLLLVYSVIIVTNRVRMIIILKISNQSKLI